MTARLHGLNPHAVLRPTIICKQLCNLLWGQEHRMKWMDKLFGNKHAGTLSEYEKRKHRCAFTGHRPEKQNRSEQEIKDVLRAAILHSISDGYNVLISGMARGVDLWAAEIVLDLRAHNKDIKLICAVPFDGVESRWSQSWQVSYHRIIHQADYIYVVSQVYSHDVFQKRNIWMVNHAARIIAVYDGNAGGTKNTIEYAQQCGIDTMIV